MGASAITLTIDGRKVAASAGETILRAARNAGIDIPAICSHEDLPSYGACRMCVVQIEGVRGFPTACTTPATDGMVVTTRNPRLAELRSRVLSLVMTGHPNACLVCDEREICETLRPHSVKAGRATKCGGCSNREQCDIRVMILETGNRDLDLPVQYAHHRLERDDPFVDRDHNLCILCGRCWRICEKIHATPAITITNRGRWAKVGTAFDRGWVSSGCTFCGACVDICPTGTLTDRFARWHGRPEEGVVSACHLCPEGCRVRCFHANGALVAARMVDFEPGSRLCALGRFALPQLVNHTERLRQPWIRHGNDLIPADWTETLKEVARRLDAHRKGGFVAIVDECDSVETRRARHAFARNIMNGRLAVVPAGGGFEDIRPESVRRDLAEGRVGAAYVAGDYLTRSAAASIDLLVLADFLPGSALDEATAVFPVALPLETDGTFLDARGEVKPLRRATPPPGQALSESRILQRLAEEMGADLPVGEPPAPPRPLAGRPRDRVADLPTRLRGHVLAESVPGLSAFGSSSRSDSAKVKRTDGFRIVRKEEPAPGFHLLEVEAPAVARHAKPGQFFIAMADERSERTPYTLVDWSREAGTISFVVQEVGRSSREIAALEPGDRIAHVTGPLGVPLGVERRGRVILGGGCFGIGAVFPLARAFKQAGNEVVCVVEASSGYMLYLEDRLRSVCDELLVVTKDGSKGTKSGVPRMFVDLHERGLRADRFVAIGCTYMMRRAAEMTKPLGVPLDVALNPIMIDGTGMCGACRVTVGGETRFACVDGPFFDGHRVDWEELFSRRAAYTRTEVEAMPQTAKPEEGPLYLPWNAASP